MRSFWRSLCKVLVLFAKGFGLLFLMLLLVGLQQCVMPAIRWECITIRTGDPLHRVKRRMERIGAFYPDQPAVPGVHQWMGSVVGEQPYFCVVRFDNDLRAVP